MYANLLDKKMTDEQAIDSLFALAREDYLKLLHEMIDHEEKTHSMENFLQKRFYNNEKILPGQSTILDQFRKETASGNIKLYERTVRVLGAEKIISNKEALFFIPLRDKLTCDRGKWQEPTRVSLFQRVVAKIKAIVKIFGNGR